MELYGKLSRLFIADDLKSGSAVALTDGHVHYLKNVLRKKAGDAVRLFNGRDGEFAAGITQLGKKGANALVKDRIKNQPAPSRKIHLLFAPIKKHRMDFLIEKSVELGVSDLHPVLTARTEARHLNADRLNAQILEAAEQCERMSVPRLHPFEKLDSKIAAWHGVSPLYWCRERADAPHISTVTEINPAFLIGPEGGFDERECAMLEAHPQVKTISLGDAVFRAETAALICLAHTDVQSSA